MCHSAPSLPLPPPLPILLPLLLPQVALSVDWHDVDLLRGPGRVTRTGPDSFTFERLQLPADVVLALCSSSCVDGDSSSSSREAGSSSSGSASDSSSAEGEGSDSDYACFKPFNETGARLFCVEFQQQQLSAEADGGSINGVGVGGVSHSSNTRDGTAVQHDSDDSSSSSSVQWSHRVAHELLTACQHLGKDEGGSSSSSSSLPAPAALADLLRAAALGSIPERSIITEAQQPVRVRQVPLPPSGECSAALPVTTSMTFVKVNEPSVTLSIGGWEVPGE